MTPRPPTCGLCGEYGTHSRQLGWWCYECHVDVPGPPELRTDFAANARAQLARWEAEGVQRPPWVRR